VCFVSEAIRADYESQGLRFPSAEVIHGGVSAQQFFYDRGDSFGANKDIRLLYAGQLTADRGLHTAIEAFRLLPPEARSSVTLTVVGESFDLNYQRQVHQQVQEAGLSQNVSFVGKKTYAEMSEVYRTHAILLAPSLRKEGFPLTMVEAMLSGCAVVTSGSGGAIEIAKPAGLPVFPKADAPALSRILERLIADRPALAKLAKRGQAVALREFTSDRMTDRFVEVFQRLCDRKPGKDFQGDPVGGDRTSAEAVVEPSL
jgi:glycosyltransferase involved in cell wall biosynthesis